MTGKISAGIAHTIRQSCVIIDRPVCEVPNAHSPPRLVHQLATAWWPRILPKRVDLFLNRFVGCGIERSELLLGSRQDVDSKAHFRLRSMRATASSNGTGVSPRGPKWASLNAERPLTTNHVYSSSPPSTLRTARKASWGMSTWPTRFMRFLPSFCFSRSLRLREMSPP
jgi:hypothetical protein